MVGKKSNYTISSAIMIKPGKYTEMTQRNSFHPNASPWIHSVSLLGLACKKFKCLGCYIFPAMIHVTSNFTIEKATRDNGLHMPILLSVPQCTCIHIRNSSTNIHGATNSVKMAQTKEEFSSHYLAIGGIRYRRILP